MKKIFNSVITGVVFLMSCTAKENEENKNFISIQSFIEKQVEHVDTSLYSIRKIIITDSLHSDTTYIRREDFREAAKEFLAIPDLSLKKVAKRYTEEPARFDKLLGRVIISYTALNPEREEYTSQELLITPNVEGEDKVRTVIVTRVIKNPKLSIYKNLLWQIDKSFQITTTSQQLGAPEKITIEKVAWNEDN